MKRFKERWEIKQNWQLLFPFLGVIFLLYSCYKLSAIFFDRANLTDIPYLIVVTAVLYYVLLKFILWTFKKLENKWIVNYKWEMIRIYIVFAITGSSAAFIGKPITTFFGITKDNLPGTLYWILYILIGLVCYQILLVTFGWIFGQFQFFWNFEKKMLKRMGFKRFLN